MKKSYLFILGFLCLLGPGPSAYAQILALNRRQVPVQPRQEIVRQTLEQALKQLENEHKIYFIYQTEKIKDRKIEYTVVPGEKAENLIERLLKSNGLDFRKHGKIYAIFPRADHEGEVNRDMSKSQPTSESQTNVPEDRIDNSPVARTVTGKVVSADDNLGLAGVSVVVKGTETGTATDSEGRYKISVADAASVLIFSFVGYQSVEETVGDRAVIDLALNADIKALGEVVVVGYGTQKRSALTSSVSKLDGNDLVSVPVGDISNAIGGRVSGVVFKQNSGEPGSDRTDIKIRGVSTTGNSSPLLVVDGIYRDFASLDPNTIASMSILKDAAAVAPYGLAGANGVIVVTTKRGHAGKTSVTYNGYLGWQNPTRLLKTVNSYQYAQLRNRAYLNENPNDAAHVPYDDAALEGYRKTSEGAPDADPDRYPNSNAVKDLVHRNAPMTSHNIQVSGGSEHVRYYAGFGYLRQQGMWPNKYMNKFNAMLNLDADLTPTTRLALSLNAIQRIVNSPGNALDQANNYIYRANSIPPTSAIYFSNGLWGSSGNGFNPVGELYTSGSRKEDQVLTYSTLSLEQDLPFIKGLSLKGTFAYDPGRNHWDYWSTAPYYYEINLNANPYTFTQVDPGVKPAYSTGYLQSRAFTYQGYLNYQNRFGDHEVTGLLVAEARQTDSVSFSALRKNYSIPIPIINQGSSNQADLGNSGTAAATRQLGFVYRVGYSYLNRYFFETAGRYDGHYYFAPGNRWGFFPSFSGAWRISEEPFLRNGAPWVSNLKLKASWGESGNLAGQPFQYLNSFNSYGEAYRIGGALAQGLSERSSANTSITWERQQQTNIGLEMVLWKGWLNFEFDYFRQKRNNMLLAPNVTLPAEYGIGLAEQNAGIMQNNGFEFTLGTNHRYDNGIQLDISGTMTYTKNKIVQIYESQATFNDPNRRRTGRPYQAQFGLVALGLFQSEEEIKNSPVQQLGNYTVGDIKFADLNNDGFVNNLDQKMIGNPNFMPRVAFGLNPKVSWKGFDINMLFQGAAGTDMMLNGVMAFAFDNAGTSVVDALDNWTPENRDATYPRITSTITSNNEARSTWWLRDGSYVRLKNLSVGYNLSRKLLQPLKMQAARVYMSSQNLLTWAKELKNSDPEAAILSNNYVTQKVLSVGLSFTY